LPLLQPQRVVVRCRASDGVRSMGLSFSNL
jgi:hypothetical protein